MNQQGQVKRDESDLPSFFNFSSLLAAIYRDLHDIGLDANGSEKECYGLPIRALTNLDTTER